MKRVIIILIILIVVYFIMKIISALAKGSSESRSRTGDPEYDEIMKRMKDLEKMIDDLDTGKGKSSSGGGGKDAVLASQSLNIDEDARVDLSASLTDEELEMLADDTRFFANEALSFSDLIKNITLELADNVDDGGVVTGRELGQLIDITTEMLEYPLYANGYGRGTPERKTILEKLKGLV